ncbi:MAG: putative toxin-antitoxin system toxin component, PIN family [Euryarchaeota archaeon]|nr:putative toxin-antitoxin system toxin component, PIN family [Euryarchaeota archaeon]
MRVFIDSNILISALVFDRNELDVLTHVLRKGHQLVTSNHIHEEVFRVMLEKLPEHAKLVDEFIRISGMEIVPGAKYLNMLDQFDIVRDRKDRHVLAAAVAAKCEMIITGDNDLLVLKRCQDVRIVASKGAKKYV